MKNPVTAEQERERTDQTRASENQSTHWPRRIHMFGAVAAVLAVLSFIIIPFDSWTMKLIVVAWMVVPPVYFFIELHWVRAKYREHLDDCRMSQESAAKIWAAVVAALTLLYLKG